MLLKFTKTVIGIGLTITESHHLELIISILSYPLSGSSAMSYFSILSVENISWRKHKKSDKNPGWDLYGQFRIISVLLISSMILSSRYPYVLFQGSFNTLLTEAMGSSWPFIINDVSFICELMGLVTLI